MQSALTALEQSIRDTLAYFDIFDYPLSAHQIYLHLYDSAGTGSAHTLANVVAALSSPALTTLVDSREGLYFLRGRESIVAMRAERYCVADQKLKRAQRAAWLLRYVPFLTSVSACNNLGTLNVRTDSDIDIFITARPGRLYLVRMLVTAAVQLMGLRRHGDDVADQLCLSFYAADDALDFTQLQEGEDIYLRYWIATLFPLYTRGGAEKFFASNAWVREYIPAYQARTTAYRRRVSSGPVQSAFVRTTEWLLGGIVGNGLERVSKGVQLRRMAHASGKIEQRGTEVVITDSLLKFHENDRRRAYAGMWREKVGTGV